MPRVRRPSPAGQDKKSESRLASGEEKLQQQLKERTLELKQTRQELERALNDCSRACADLEREHMLRQEVTASISGPYFSVDRDYRYTSFNLEHAEVMKTLYGAEIELGGNLLEYHSVSSDRRSAKGNIDRAMRGETFSVEALAGDEVHNRHYFEILHKPLVENGGKVSGVSVNARDITMRVLAERQLRQANELLEAVTAGTDVIIAAMNRNFRYSYFNTAYRDQIERLTGKELKVGNYLSEIFADLPDQLAEAMDEWSSAMQGENTNRTIRFGDPGHYPRSYHVMRTPLRDLDGNVIGAGEVAYDVTRQVQAENLLRQSEARYRNLVELSPYPIFVYQSGQVVQVNPAMLDLFGAERPEQLLGKTPYDLFHPDYHAIARDRIQKILDDQTVPLIEEKIVRLDGLAVDVEVTGSGFEENDGPAIQVVLHDITDRKRHDNELHRLNRTLRSLSDINQAMMRSPDEAAFMQAVCRIVVEDCGHAMVWIGFAHEDEEKTVEPVASAGFEEGYLETLHITWADTERGRGPTGTAIRTGQVSKCRNMLTDPAFAPWRGEALKRGYASSIVLPLMEETRAFGAITIYAREADPFSEDEVALLSELANDLAYGILSLRSRITRQQAEQAERRSEARYHALFATTSDGIWFQNQEGVILQVNDAYCRMSGYSREELVGMPISSLEASETAEEIARHIRQVVEGNGRDNFESHHRRKDGTLFDVEISALYLKEEYGQVAVFVRDITERKQAEEQLHQAAEQLRSSNDELTRFNNLMIGRELRMVELKQEVNTLCEQAGLPRRYPLNFTEEGD
jgi:PAS domain S-box-containing protein